MEDPVNKLRGTCLPTSPFRLFHTRSSVVIRTPKWAGRRRKSQTQLLGQVLFQNGTELTREELWCHLSSNATRACYYVLDNKEDRHKRKSEYCRINEKNIGRGRRHFA